MSLTDFTSNAVVIGGASAEGITILIMFISQLNDSDALKGKGLVHSREHLESLVESMDSGVASLQDYVEQHLPELDKSMQEKVS